MLILAAAAAFIVLFGTAPPAAAQSESPAAEGPEQPVQGPVPTPADVLFFREMIPHHAQALEMAALVADRTESRTTRLLAERIEVSQRDEIAWMQRWLEKHGAEAPEVGDHHHGNGHHGEGHHGDGHHEAMPGMLTPDEMAHLAGATGAEFDRLFLHYMIRHHEGALTMVSRLFSSPGAAQLPEVYGFASDVDADQRAEIERMRALLEAMPASEVPAPATALPHHH